MDPELIIRAEYYTHKPAKAAPTPRLVCSAPTTSSRRWARYHSPNRIQIRTVKIMGQKRNDLLRRFEALGCPCEILLETTEAAIADEQLTTARQEAERIEEKIQPLSSGTISSIASTTVWGTPLKSTMKRRRFWITPPNATPLAAACSILRERTGTTYHGSGLTSRCPRGYAKSILAALVKNMPPSKILELLRKRHAISTLVNLGGDIAVAGQKVWSIGIEDITRPGNIIRYGLSS